MVSTNEPALCGAGTGATSLAADPVVGAAPTELGDKAIGERAVTTRYL